MKARDTLARELLGQSDEWESRLECLENRMQRAAVKGDVLPLEVFSLMENLRRIQFQLRHRLRQVQAGQRADRKGSLPEKGDKGRKEFQACYDRALTLLSPD